VSDDDDRFFAELQTATLALPDAAPAIDLDGDDGWYERAASNQPGDEDASARPAGAIGAAALPADREAAPLAARRRRHRPREHAATPPRHPRTPRRLAAFAAVGLLLLLALAVVLNPANHSSHDTNATRDAATSRSADVKPPAASSSTTAQAPRSPAGPPPATAKRRRIVARRRAARPARQAKTRQTHPRPAALATSIPTRATTAALAPAAARTAPARRAPRQPGPARPSFTPGDLPRPSDRP
jgi:hypothetical protein